MLLSDSGGGRKKGSPRRKCDCLCGGLPLYDGANVTFHSRVVSCFALALNRLANGSSGSYHCEFGIGLSD